MACFLVPAAEAAVETAAAQLVRAFEHLWHGEVVAWFPFLTAASDPAETAVMLSEMSTVGVTMAVLVTAVWVGMLVVCNVLLKRARKQASAAK